MRQLEPTCDVLPRGGGWYVRTRSGAIPAAHALYASVIEPLPAQVLKRRLIVVPGGPLNLVAFDAFTDGGGHYVLETHVVTYPPSSSSV